MYDGTINKLFKFQGKNGTFELYLVGDKGIFDVTPFKGINEASFLIRVNDPSYLDYEQVTVMNFSLVAKEIVSKDPKMRLVFFNLTLYPTYSKEFKRYSYIYDQILWQYG